MPVTYGTFTKQLKLLPITLNADGTADVTVRFGFSSGADDFEATTEQRFRLAVEEVSTLLDATPAPGHTRRQDMAAAVYAFLVSSGRIEPGEIS